MSVARDSDVRIAIERWHGLGADVTGNNFQFSSQPAQPQPKAQKIASTASRYKPKAAYDPFAASEDDFYAARPATKSELRSMMFMSKC